MKNNKAFTLIELVVIIVILGVIMVFALPNITSTLERNKKDKMIIDAKDMVEKAKNYILSGKASYPIGTGETKLALQVIDTRDEIKESPFGNSYTKAISNVTVKVVSGVYQYSVCLTDGSYTLKADDISELNNDNKYTKINTVNTCS